jgi:hypothetical protein
MMEADLDRDGKISFEEFSTFVGHTDVSMSLTLGKLALTEYHLTINVCKINSSCRSNSPGLQPESSSPT